MKKLLVYFLTLTLFGIFLINAPAISAQGGVPPSTCGNVNTLPACQSIDTGDLGFQIPSLGDILTFTVRVFFVIAGLAALLYLLLGALAWITSGGDKDAVSAAQQKIQAAVIGMILIVAVLAIIWTLEQVVFKRRICLGLSCPLTLPGIIETSTGKSCCACVRKSDGKLVDVINSFGSSCNDDGTKYIPTSST